MNSATRDIESRDTFEMILKHISDFLKDSSFQDAAKEIVCSVLEGMFVGFCMTTLTNDINFMAQALSRTILVNGCNLYLLLFVFKV